MVGHNLRNRMSVKDKGNGTKHGSWGMLSIQSSVCVWEGEESQSRIEVCQYPRERERVFEIQRGLVRRVLKFSCQLVDPVGGGGGEGARANNE